LAEADRPISRMSPERLLEEEIQQPHRHSGEHAQPPGDRRSPLVSKHGLHSGTPQAEHLRADLVIDALQMAARNYPLDERYSTPTVERNPDSTGRRGPPPPGTPGRLETAPRLADIEAGPPPRQPRPASPVIEDDQTPSASAFPSSLTVPPEGRTVNARGASS
jgi:hypothetical protein